MDYGGDGDALTFVKNHRAFLRADGSKLKPFEIVQTPSLVPA